MPDKNILSGFNFFSDLTPEELDALASKCDILELKANDVVFRYEEPAEHFYGLVDGEVDLTLVFTDRVLKTQVEYEESVHAQIVDEEKQIVVDTVLPGQVFGWASIIGDNRRTVTARCTAPSRIIAIPASDLNALFDGNHSLGYRLMRRMANIVSNRLKNRTNKLIEAWVEAFDVGEI